MLESGAELTPRDSCPWGLWGHLWGHTGHGSSSSQPRTSSGLVWSQPGEEQGNPAEPRAAVRNVESLQLSWGPFLCWVPAATTEPCSGPCPTQLAEHIKDLGTGGFRYQDLGAFSAFLTLPAPSRRGWQLQAQLWELVVLGVR